MRQSFMFQKESFRKNVKLVMTRNDDKIRAGKLNYYNKENQQKYQP